MGRKMLVLQGVQLRFGVGSALSNHEARFSDQLSASYPRRKLAADVAIFFRSFSHYFSSCGWKSREITGGRAILMLTASFLCSLQYI
jgi:hypothetical protein